MSCFFLFLFATSTLVLVNGQASEPVQGTQCSLNQVVHRLSVYEDGAVEAVCGPMPCGTSGASCTDNQTGCRAEADRVFSGMSWAYNGQSIVLRCCAINVAKKVYVGTDLVAFNSYYQGGAVAGKERYGGGGQEYDFITNIRTEQGGVRVWVHRIVCPVGDQPPSQQQTQLPSQRSIIVPDARARQPTAIAAENPAFLTPQDSQTSNGGAPVPVVDGRNYAFEKRRQYLMRQIASSRNTDAQPETAEHKDEQPTIVAKNPLQYRPTTAG